MQQGRSLLQHHNHNNAERSVRTQDDTDIKRKPRNIRRRARGMSAPAYQTRQRSPRQTRLPLMQQASQTG